MEMSAGKRWSDGKIHGIAGGLPDVGEEDWSGRRSRKTSPIRQHVGVELVGGEAIKIDGWEGSGLIGQRRQVVEQWWPWCDSDESAPLVAWCH